MADHSGQLVICKLQLLNQPRVNSHFAIGHAPSIDLLVVNHMDLPRPTLRIGAKHPYMRNEALHDIFNALRLTAMRIKLFMLAGLANNLRVLLSSRLTDLGRGYHTRQD